MRQSLSKACTIWMTFACQSSAEGASEHLRHQRVYCLPLEEMEAGQYALGILSGSPVLSATQQHVLAEFGATDIIVFPLNMRRDYENYCHTLYYNDYEDLDTAIGYLIEEQVDERAMAFEEPETSAYVWRVMFCTEEEIGQEQKDRLMAAITPASWLWNELVSGDVSPTSIFK